MVDDFNRYDAEEVPYIDNVGQGTIHILMTEDVGGTGKFTKRQDAQHN